MATQAFETPILSDDEFLAIDVPGYKVEDGLDGNIVLTPASPPHEIVISVLNARLETHADEHRLGMMFSSNVLWRLAPGTRRLSPDLAFVAVSRYETYQRSRRGEVVEMVPDLVVEVLSPSDKLKAGGLKEHARSKLEEYRRHRVPLLWVLDDLRPAATVYSYGREGTVLEGDERLEGGDVIKGFSVALSDIYRRVRELYPLSNE